MIVSIVSGKGGTGKTTVATNLAVSAGENIQLLDCDVEAPNGHLFLPLDNQSEERVCVKIPRVNEFKCTLCGQCQEACAFQAISVLKEKVLVLPELCHSCGACSFFCPSKAIEEIDKEVGTVTTGKAGGLPFSYGALDIGQAMAIPVIKEVKRHTDASRHVIVDAPPGTSCPVIAAVKGCDYCVVVTEPTPFGLNDFELITDLLKEIKIPFGAVINRADLGSADTENFCEKEKIPILLKLPFDRKIAEVYSRGQLLVKALPEYRGMFDELWQLIQKNLKTRERTGELT